MSSAPISSDPQLQAVYGSEMSRYRNKSRTVDGLRGKGITYLNSKESRDKEWWGACNTYTAIALFVIFVLVCVVVATLAGTGILFNI